MKCWSVTEEAARRGCHPRTLGRRIAAGEVIPGAVVINDRLVAFAAPSEQEKPNQEREAARDFAA